MRVWGKYKLAELLTWIDVERDIGVVSYDCLDLAMVVWFNRTKGNVDVFQGYVDKRLK